MEIIIIRARNNDACFTEMHSSPSELGRGRFFPQLLPGPAARSARIHTGPRNRLTQESRAIFNTVQYHGRAQYNIKYTSFKKKIKKTSIQNSTPVTVNRTAAYNCRGSSRPQITWNGTGGAATTGSPAAVVLLRTSIVISTDTKPTNMT